MAEAGAQVDVIRAHEPRRLLERVIGLVDDPARGGEEAQAIARHAAQLLADDRQRLVPRQAVEAVAPGAVDQRERQAAQLAQLLVRERAQRGEVAELMLGDRSHGVQAQELEARHAQVDARDHVVAQPARPERASVTHAVPEDAPGVPEVVAVLPGDLDHLPIGPRTRVASGAEGEEVTQAEAAAAGAQGRGAHSCV